MSPTEMPAARVAVEASAITQLRVDHNLVTALFAEFAAARSNDEKAAIATEICTELIVHMILEEEIFYPACRDALVDGRVLDAAQIEHDTAKILIGGLLLHEPDSPYFDARMAVLAEYIKHHVDEEEKSGCGIFAKAKAADVDMSAVGKRLRQRRRDLMAQIAKNGLTPPVPRSLDLDLIFRFYQEHLATASQHRSVDDEGGRRTRRAIQPARESSG